MSLDSEVAEALAAITAKDSSVEGLALIRKLIADGYGERLIADLLGPIRAKHSTQNYYDAVDRTYIALTELFDHEKFSSLVLMAYLWPFADNTYIGYIWDSIGIYLGEGMSDELKVVLIKIGSRTTDEGMRKRYEEWATIPSVK
jgi:hypothetical protein